MENTHRKNTLKEILRRELSEEQNAEPVKRIKKQEILFKLQLFVWSI